MKRKNMVILLSLLMAALFLFAGCAQETGTPNGDNTPDVGAPDNESGGEENNNGNADSTPEEEKKEEVKPRLYLNGIDISQYSIVCEAPKEKSGMGEYWREEYDCGKVTAIRLSALIEEKFGVKLKSYYDTAHKEEAHEILIGNTNRAESKTLSIKRLTYDQYMVAMNNGKLVICGGAPGTTYHAIDSIEEYLKSTVENNEYKIDENSNLSGSYHLERIAILGDSISVGALTTDYKNNNGLRGYAAQTGRMYWQECVLKTYAQAGICLREDLKGFATTSLWTDFYNDLKTKKFDTVLILLGANDGYTDALVNGAFTGEWTDDDDKSFTESLETMIKSIHERRSETQIVVMNCVAYYRSADPNSPDYRDSHYHSSPRVIALQGKVVTDLRAQGSDYVHLFDMNSYSKKYTTKAMFSDLLHPDDQGHEILAKGVVAMLKLLREGQTDQYLVN